MCFSSRYLLLRLSMEMYVSMVMNVYEVSVLVHSIGSSSEYNLLLNA